jgi:hypothetical protein
MVVLGGLQGKFSNKVPGALKANVLGDGWVEGNSKFRSIHLTSGYGLQRAQREAKTLGDAYTTANGL